jgi:hypothetical protein
VWLNERFPTLVRTRSIVSEVYALYMMWCLDGAPGAPEACGPAQLAQARFLDTLAVPGTPLAVPTHRLATLLNAHAAEQHVLHTDRSLHDSVWDELVAHVFPAAGELTRAAQRRGKAEFDRLTAVARAVAQPVDPASPSPVQGLAPVIGIMRHAVAARVDGKGDKGVEVLRVVVFFFFFSFFFLLDLFHFLLDFACGDAKKLTFSHTHTIPPRSIHHWQARLPDGAPARGAQCGRRARCACRRRDFPGPR